MELPDEVRDLHASVAWVLMLVIPLFFCLPLLTVLVLFPFFFLFFFSSSLYYLHHFIYIYLIQNTLTIMESTSPRATLWGTKNSSVTTSSCSKYKPSLSLPLSSIHPLLPLLVSLSHACTLSLFSLYIAFIYTALHENLHKANIFCVVTCAGMSCGKDLALDMLRLELPMRSQSIVDLYLYFCPSMDCLTYI